jgi:hypothetical protein
MCPPYCDMHNITVSLIHVMYVLARGAMPDRHFRKKYSLLKNTGTAGVTAGYTAERSLIEIELMLLFHIVHIFELFKSGIVRNSKGHDSYN